jgi:hypothetical protein
MTCPEDVGKTQLTTSGAESTSYGDLTTEKGKAGKGEGGRGKGKTEWPRHGAPVFRSSNFTLLPFPFPFPFPKKLFSVLSVLSVVKPRFPWLNRVSRG